jgi:hypothetical protein
MSTVCECGCGENAKEGRRFISGHNTRGSIKKARIEKVCLYCKKSFTGTEASIKNRVYCCKKCRDDHRKTLIGPLNVCYTSFEMKCEICGKVFITQPARQKNSQVYCSMECGREGRRKKISGKSRSTRPFGKHKAKVRDHFSCKICKFDLVVHAHHIIPKKEGGTNHISNIITLCPNHHAMAHSGLLTVREMCLAINTPIQDAEKLRTRAKNTIDFRADVL